MSEAYKDEPTIQAEIRALTDKTRRLREELKAITAPGESPVNQAWLHGRDGRRKKSVEPGLTKGRAEPRKKSRNDSKLK